MHNHTLTVSRSTETGFVAYPYRFEATVRLPARDLWAHWIETLIDYRKTWLWPTRYSQPSVPDSKVEKGGRVTMSYRIPNPYDSTKPDARVSHEFDIVECSDEDMLFEYGTTDRQSFLQGGGVFQVTAVDNGTSLLIWHGEYRHAAGDARIERQGDAFVHYLCTFYTSAAERIRKADRGFAAGGGR